MELAKRGEIDPWDIDIAKATEKFLQYIDSLEKRDLRIPARTLLYASILLRMKSDSMEGQKEEEPEPEMEEIRRGAGRGDRRESASPSSEKAHQAASDLGRADLRAEEGGDGGQKEGHAGEMAKH